MAVSKMTVGKMAVSKIVVGKIAVSKMAVGKMAVSKTVEGATGVGILDVLVIIFIVVAALGVGLYFLNRWASSRMADQQDAVERNKTTVSIYVIDKKKDKITHANLPKAAVEQMPKWSRLMKMPLVKAKIGPQIMTLMCDGKVFPVLPVKKTVKVDLAGMYIVGMKGMKTKKEMADLRKARQQEKAVEQNKPSTWYGALLQPLSQPLLRLFRRKG